MQKKFKKIISSLLFSIKKNTLWISDLYEPYRSTICINRTDHSYGLLICMVHMDH